MIFSGNKPLFNRKYLLALVWLLPIAILLLSRLGSDDAEVAKVIAPNQVWLQDDKSTLNIYFSQGSGLTSNDQARQSLLLEGLSLRLNDSQINELLYEQGWRVKTRGASLYTQLTLSASKTIDPIAVERLIALLKQPPAIDWTAIIERINAEAYLASQTGRQRALNALLSSSDAQLNARTYVELVDQPIHLMFQTPDEPARLQLQSHTPLRVIQPGKTLMSVRSKRAGSISLWQMPAPTSSEEYLAQQALGMLVSQTLAALPDTRIQQQLSPQGSLLLIETSAESAELTELIGAMSADSPTASEAVNELEKRWIGALEQSASAWSEATLLYDLEPEALSATLETVRNEQQTLLAPLIERLQQNPDRRARLFTAEKG